MKTGEAFPGSYIKASDLQGRRIAVKISDYKMEEVGGEQKPVLYFEGKERGLVLNRTNANMIAEILGTDEMDEWIGGRIMLFPTKTEFQGRRVDCIRIEAAPKGQPKPAVPAAVPAPAPAPRAATVGGGFVAEDSDVPF